MIKQYDSDHWSREKDAEKGIAKYLALVKGKYQRVRNDLILNRLINFDLNGKTGLDYGCGIGYFSIQLVKRGAHVTGLDISRDAINTAIYYSNKEGVSSKCSFRICSLDFSELDTLGLFDFILLKDIIEHIEEDVRFLDLLIPHLKLNGHLIVTTPNPLSLSHLVDFLYHRCYLGNTMWVGGGDETHVRLYSTRALKKLLDNYGLKRVRVQAVGLITDDLLRYLTLLRSKVFSYPSTPDEILGALPPFCYLGAGQLNLFRRIEK